MPKNRFFGIFSTEPQAIRMKFCMRVVTKKRHSLEKFGGDRPSDVAMATRNGSVFLSVYHAPFRPLSAGGSARSRCQTTWILVDTVHGVEKTGNFQHGRSQKRKTHFLHHILGEFPVSRVQVTGDTFQPNQWYHWKAETPVRFPPLVTEVVALTVLELGGPKNWKN